MTYVQKMGVYLKKHSDEYNIETVEYTKTLVKKIETDKGVIYDLFKEKNIKFERFLEETMMLSEYRLKYFGNVELSKKDFEEVLDFLIIEIDVEKLLKNGHLEEYDLEDDDSVVYVPDQFAVDFMKEKYDIDLEIDKPFDYNIFYEEPDEEYDKPIFDLLNNICLN